ncbi:Qat anti-phage system associated protein QatB [Oceanobacillus sp. HCA-5259]|uniref:Qat anti-phage system associated protein QatB n=1 Tax=Oceanobacillus sp. HCA-5259 TaxID=3134661 RepID=UPI0030C3EA62
MGTSSIYNGPMDNPLLPEGFEDEYEEFMNVDDQELEGSWQETKKVISQYITGTIKNQGRVLRNYVKASGGARASANRAVSGRGSSIRLGQLLSGIVSEGIIKTLERLKIEYKGKSAEALISEMVNVISPRSNTKEDIVAKNATIQALSQLYEYITENNMDINSLDNMNDEMFNEVMSLFVSNYIFEKMLNDLQSRFEKYAEDSHTALEKERELEEYIKESVNVKLNKVSFNELNYNESSIDSIISEIYIECYEVLEVYI